MTARDSGRGVGRLMTGSSEQVPAVSAWPWWAVSRGRANALFNLGQIVQDARMSDPYGLSRPSIPATYAQLLLEILAERGIPATQALQGGRLPGTLFTTPDARITPRQWSRLVLTALRLTHDDGLGYEYGLRLRPTAHGVLGYALMSCATLSQALELGAMFFSMRLRDYRMEFRYEGEVAVIEIAETHPVVGALPQEAQMLRRFFHECVMLGIVHAGRALTGLEPEGVELCVDWPEPACHARYRERLPPMRFGQVANQIRMPAAFLQAPLLMADPMTHQQAVAQCVQEQVRFAETVEDLAARVRAELVLVPGEGYPGLEAVAARLHMSGRTLKRRLQALDLGFLALLDEARRQEAEQLLKTTDREVRYIAELLGYTGPANFSRAFRKWTGMTPSEFRERQQQ